ncbi:MAG TPA: glycosyltransferase family 2 protein [Acidimicrobiales bacterium]|nr:glycosyltransferase family 2 protein [Acidimicrobiales bacterium]
MRKLIIQVPCLNEEDQLPVTMAAFPRSLPGFDIVEWLVIDDGLTDRTVEVARACGIDHVVRLTSNRGLSAAFQAGLDAAVKLGADVVVNTTPTINTPPRNIAALVAPILAGEAELVVGDRNVRGMTHFSKRKRRMQLLRSWVVRHASDLDVPDATSGLRAYNCDAALSVVVVSRWTKREKCRSSIGRRQGLRPRGDRKIWDYGAPLAWERSVPLSISGSVGHRRC